MHLKRDEAVQGVVKWDFFTKGYSPLRITSIYPPPGTCVKPDNCHVIVGLSQDIVESGLLRDWITVISLWGD